MSNSKILPEYLVGLNAEQLTAVRHSGSNLLVNAGAGSGKTRVVIARILYHILEQGIPPWQILAVTFTNRATREMRERLATNLASRRSEAVLIRTFHSFGAWFLRRYAKNLAANFTIYDDDDSIALLKQSWPAVGKKAKILQRTIAKLKDSGFGYSPELSPLWVSLEEYSHDPDFPEAYLRYQEALQRSGNVDFADLLGLPTAILHSDAQLCMQMQQRFRRILVDEYQDSNPLQNQLLHLLLGHTKDQSFAAEKTDVHGSVSHESLQSHQGRSHNKQEGRSQELCIVGDEDQSIYGFRGAEIGHILEFQQRFAPAQVLKLEQNYRSRRPILELANYLIGQNHERLGKELRPTKEGGPLPEFHYFESHEDEAVFAAQKITQRPGLRSAILYRTNAQSRTFERVFREYGIPYRLVGNLSFYRREEIKDIIAYLKCLANPCDMVSFERMLTKPKRGLGLRVLNSIQTALDSVLDPALGHKHKGEGVQAAMQLVLQRKALANRSLKLLEKFAQQFAQWQSFLSDSKPLLLELIQEVLEHSGLWQHYQERDEQEASERCQNFDSLLEEVQHYGSGIPALVAFLESVELETEELQNEEEEMSAEEQLLITMHNTKGLEFERVFITGLELGIFPKYEALEQPQIMEEERRLLYVAITRAEEELYLSAAQSRMLYGHIQHHALSPLFEKLQAHLCLDCSPQQILCPEQEGPILHKSMRGKKILAKHRPEEQGFAAIPDEVIQKKSTAAGDPFVLGARVEHLDYGLGYVVKRKQSGGITTLMIKLDDGRLIRLQLEFQKHKLDFLGTADSTF